MVRTDYEGLGTPGAHPFLVGRSEGRSVLDAARAARKLEPRLSRKTVIAGHSQGGHAALWAASLARKWTPELQLSATVAFAPASHIEAQARALPNLKSPGGSLSALGALIFRGIDTAKPSLNVTGLLSDRAAALYPRTLSTCLPQLSATASFGGLVPADLVRSGADLNGVFAALGASDPEKLKPSSSVRIEQGTADNTTFKVFTDALVQAYKKAGVKVSYKTYAGVSHGGVVTSAADDATSFIRARLGR